MKISDKLYITIPIYESNDVANIIAYVHSAPISAAVFEAHFMLLGRTFSAIYSSGLGPVAGPRVAYMLLNKVAKEQTDELSAMSLMNEIRRLTNVLLRTPNGWEHLPFQTVADSGMLEAEDISEVTNAITFFTVLSSTHRRADRLEMMTGAAKMWAAQITSLDFTAFAASLPTSTALAPIAPTPEVSSAVY